MRRLLPLVLLFVLWVPAAHAWTWPVGGPVVQGFAFDPAHPYTGGQHRGVDIGASAGAPVAAPAAGVVTFAGSVPTSGLTVTIGTADGLSVTLTHLGSLGVTRGASVAEGAVIGTVGPSGTAEVGGPYVHLGIRLSTDPNGYLDPLSLLPSAPPAAEPDSEPAQEPAATAPPPAVQGSDDAASAPSDAAPPNEQPPSEAASPTTAEGSGNATATSDGASPPTEQSPTETAPTETTPTAVPSLPASASGNAESPASGDAALPVTPSALEPSSPAAAEAQSPAAASGANPLNASIEAPAPERVGAAAKQPPTEVAPSVDAKPAPVAESAGLPVRHEPQRKAATRAPAPSRPAPAAIVGEQVRATSTRRRPASGSDVKSPTAPVVSRPAEHPGTAHPARPHATHHMPGLDISSAPAAPGALGAVGHRSEPTWSPITPSAAPSTATPSTRPSPPLLLIGVALAGIVAVAVGFTVVRMISSPSPTAQGACSGAAEAATDTRRPRLAVCERSAPHRPCGGLCCSGGRVRPLPPLAGEPCPDGERNGRARDARHGVRRPERRLAA